LFPSLPQFLFSSLFNLSRPAGCNYAPESSLGSILSQVNAGFPSFPPPNNGFPEWRGGTSSYHSFPDRFFPKASPFRTRGEISQIRRKLPFFKDVPPLLFNSIRKCQRGRRPSHQGYPPTSMLFSFFSCASFLMVQ